ncbi:hypothetical protein FRC17_002149 [Serendipita sp. 399]|nr:hypothetical protein FRC17_002149 [Serendipita sp. 399]
MIQIGLYLARRTWTPGGMGMAKLNQLKPHLKPVYILIPLYILLGSSFPRFSNILSWGMTDQIHQFTKKDKIVVVMGPTGSGKSTFVNYAVGECGLAVGHQLKSCTSDVVIRKTIVNGQSIAFVDTPGFNDTNKSDHEILRKIAEFLGDIKKKGFQLERLLYLHRISENRMAGRLINNLEVFASLGGDVAMPNVTIVTTMWKVTRRDVAERRLGELKTTFWDKMLHAGCKVSSFEDSMQSALSISMNLENTQCTPLLSHELVVDRRPLSETEAGITLNKQMKRLLESRKEANRRLTELANTQTDPKVRENLGVEMKKIEDEIAEVTSKLRKSVLPFSTIMRRWFFKPPTPDIPRISESNQETYVDNQY